MSKLSDLVSKGKNVTLSNGLVIEIKPITLKEEIEISEFQKKEEYAKAIAFMVTNAIKRAIPEATDEEIDNLNKEDIKLLSEEVLLINGLSSGKNE